ncbi:MAG: hypothetical protein JWO37_1070 [Acidimicrobiales bacterium]|jgi:uncharacterized protein|nr:hypothetical protein [Acidimicrobiales bacterium]
MRPFAVSVADIHHRPGARRRERLEAGLPGLQVLDTAVPDQATVEVEVLLEAVSDGILATGSARAPWRSECRRCLRAVEGDAEVTFRELFEEHPTEGETWPLQHEEVDLEPLVRESLLLALPLAPLCDDACRGLCPTCGADLNEGPCDCVPDDRDPRWAALDVLRSEQES